MSASKAEKVQSQPKQQAFDADVSRVMDIVINSLYSKRKIFFAGAYFK